MNMAVGGIRSLEVELFALTDYVATIRFVARKLILVGGRRILRDMVRVLGQ
jgi:hypothetical protein